MKKITVQQLSIFAAMIALHIVLEFVSIRIGNDYKITFSGLPILVIAILYGPGAGFVVGLVGAILSQLLTFGITPTTPIWILPPAIHGLVMGILYRLFVKKIKYVNLIICIFAAGLVNTICNLLATYFDSQIWHYYYEGYIMVLIPIRLVNWALTAAVSAIVLLVVIKALKKRFPALLNKNLKESAK